MAALIGKILLTVIVPVFALIGAGWAVHRKFRVDLDTLVKLNSYLFVPAFIFVKLSEQAPGQGLAPRLVLFTLAVITAMGILSQLVSWMRKDPAETAGSLKLASMFYNCGNFGLPATSLAFGPESVHIQVFVLMTMNIATFTLGTLIASAHHPETGWRRLLPVLRQPSLHAVAAALLLKQAGLNPAQWPFIWQPLHLIADGLVGLALVTLGVQLSTTRPPPLRGNITAALAIRLLAGPALAFIFAAWFGFDRETTRVLVLGAAAPTAVNTAMLAHEFDADVRLASGAVFYTTLCSIATITVVLALLARW